MSSSRLKA